MQITKEYVEKNIELFITNQEEFWRDATEIADYAFYDFDDAIHPNINNEKYIFKEIVIPDAITKIGAHAFEECDNLEKVTLPANLKKIEDCTFKFCPSLFSIELPNSIEEIGEEAFYESRLENIIFPAGLKKIGKKAFACNNFKNIVLPELITNIEQETFENCNNLEQVELNQNIKTIGRKAFANCYNLIKITICENVDSICTETFSGCENLELVVLKNKDTKIGKLAFECTNIFYLNIKENEKIFSNKPLTNDSISFNNNEELMSLIQ